MRPSVFNGLLGRQIDAVYVKHHTIGLEFLRNIIEQGARALAALVLRFEQPFLTCCVEEVAIGDALAGALCKGATIEVPATDIRARDHP